MQMTAYLEIPKQSILKLTQTIKEFSKLTIYKINIHKSIAFTYKNNNQLEYKMKVKAPCTMQHKKTIYLETNLINVQILYEENFKASQKIEKQT